jgi:hypothetical protein
MAIAVLIVIVILILIFSTKSIEKLENLKDQRYLSFLSNVNENFKSKAPKTGAFRGSCDDRINTQIQLKALHEEYSRIQGTEHSRIHGGNNGGDPCVSVANYLCEFTHPNMYLSETQMAPKWLMKSLKDVSPPTHINLSCFATNYDCCKNATLQK